MPTKLSLWPYIVVSLAITGVISVLIATVNGIGVSPDSIAYIGAARNLLEGRGLSLPYGQLQDSPLTHFPPVYSLLLATSGLFGVEVLQVARWYHAFLLGAQILLAGFVLYRFGSPWLAVVGSALLLTSAALLTISVMAWTEALFLVLSLLAIWLLATFLEGSDQRFLAAAAVVMGLATLTRYAGIALIITGGLAVLLFSQDSRLKKLYNLIVFGLLSVLPLAIWLLRNVVTAGNATNREFLFHPVSRAQLLQAVDTVSGWWLVPSAAPFLVKLVIVLVSFSLMAVALWLRPPRYNLPGQRTNFSIMAKPSLPQLLALFVIVYFAFLVFSISFIDANTPLDARSLAPAYLAGLLATLYIVHYIGIYFQTGRKYRLFLSIVALCFLTFSARDGIIAVAGHFERGIGFASVAWQQSKVIELTKQFPAGTPIFSNAPDALYFLTGRRSLGIPKKSIAMTRQTNSLYEVELETMRQMLKAEEGVIVYLSNLGRASSSQEAELQSYLHLSVVFQADDGTIYKVASDTELASH